MNTQGSIFFEIFKFWKFCLDAERQKKYIVILIFIQDKSVYSVIRLSKLKANNNIRGYEWS